MKTTLVICLLSAAVACAADRPPAGLLDSSFQSRIGFDSNPLGTSGTSAAILGGENTLTYSAGLSLTLALISANPAQPALKLMYTGDMTRFDRWSGENFSTHRFGFNGKFTAGVWKFTGDGSSLLVAGSRDTLLSVPTINANAIPLWRERRRQWQHRLKLQTQAEFGAWLVRSTGTLLSNDYQTNVVAGRVAFSDRTDVQGALDLGWKQSGSSLWFVGVRTGHQTQAIIPLPNCEFEYSNLYDRLAVGWEGQPFAHTTVTLFAGPDFRHYSGAIDSRVFLNGRNRTSLWFEATITSQITPVLTLTGKAVRMAWLSSTGKSAYIDTCAETAATLTLSSAWSLRLTAKVHRNDYFPAIRDDWESLVGAGASWKLSKRTVVTLDLLRHRAWNNLPALPERQFQRAVINLGATIKL